MARLEERVKSGRSLSRREVAAHFGVSESTVDAWREAGLLPYMQAGPRCRVSFDPADVAALAGRLKRGHFSRDRLRL